MTLPIADPIVLLLRQIERLLGNLSDEHYTTPIPVLSGSTLGQHTRHIIEFYIELIKGYETGEVNYDARRRDHRIESDRRFAITSLALISRHLEMSNKAMKVTACYTHQTDVKVTVDSNYYRELMYNLEHTVHHMAILRIGVIALAAAELPESFGVAVSTLKYRNACAQ